MNEPLGSALGLQEKRASLVANLSPAAKRAAFPKVYARPEPYTSSKEELLRRQVTDLRAQVGTLTKTCAQLRETVAGLQSQLQTSVMVEALRQTQRTIPPEKVIDAFLKHYSAQIGEKITIDHLASHHRVRIYSAPRHCCIWLVRQLSTHLSLPKIGKLFGGRDHTTCMHACERAPYWMLVNPALKTAVDATLLQFGVGAEGTQ